MGEIARAVDQVEEMWTLGPYGCGDALPGSLPGDDEDRRRLGEFVARLRVLQEFTLALQESEERFRTLAQFSPDAIIMADERGRIVSWNHAAENMLGYAADEVVGTPLSTIVPAVARELHQLPSVQATAAGGEFAPMHMVEVQLTRRDGTVLSVEHSMQLRKSRAGVFATAILRDLSERKRAALELERRNRRVAALSRMGQHVLASLDLSTVFTSVVEECSQLLGGRDVSLLLRENGELVFAALSSSSAQSLRGQRVPLASGIVGEVIRTGKSVIGGEEQVQACGSEQIPGTAGGPVRSMIVAPLTLDDETIGVIETIDSMPDAFDEGDESVLEGAANWAAIAIRNARQHGEIRRQLAATERLAEQNAKLLQELEKALAQEQAARSQLVLNDKLAAMGRMVASVAHELNNPLQAMTNCLYLLQQNMPPDSQDMPVMDMAFGEMQRLSDLVTRLRAVYRPSAAGQMRVLVLEDLLEQVRVLAAPQLVKNHVHWQLTATGPRAVTVKGFVEPLKQVFLNLCLNAVDAMSAKGGVLDVRLTPSADGGEIGVEFEDTGHGIPEADLQHVFEPFFTTKERGMGLGLAICHDIVQKHSGHMTVSSRLGNGATFTVWLPLALAK